MYTKPTLWYWESGKGRPARPRTACEKPQLATTICWAVNIATTAVDPATGSALILGLHPHACPMFPHGQVSWASRCILWKLLSRAVGTRVGHLASSCPCEAKFMFSSPFAHPTVVKTRRSSSATNSCIRCLQTVDTYTCEFNHNVPFFSVHK